MTLNTQHTRIPDGIARTIRWFLIAAVALFAGLAIVLAATRRFDTLLSSAATSGFIALSAIFAATLRGSRHTQAAVFLVGLSSAASLYVLEVGIHVHTLYKLHNRLDAKIAKLLDLRGQNLDVWPSVFPRNFFHRVWDEDLKVLREPKAEEQGVVAGGTFLLPLGGIASARTLYCEEEDDWLIYQADERGFNNPSGLWERPPIDILSVGDSYTLGACVPPGSSAIDTIRRQFARTVNLGMGGNGPLTMLANLKEFGSFLRPKAVLWLFFDNDVRVELNLETTNQVLRRYLEPGFRQDLLKIPQDAIDRSLKDLVTATLRSTLDKKDRHFRDSIAAHLADIPLLRGLRTATGLWLREPPEDAYEPADPLPSVPAVPNFERNYGLFHAILAEAKAVAESFGATVYFVVVPSRYELLDLVAADPRRQRAESIRRTVVGIARDHGLPVVDGVEIFAGTENKKSLLAWISGPAPGYGHLSKEGYRLFGEALAARLKGDGVMPSP